MAQKILRPDDPPADSFTVTGPLSQEELRSEKVLDLDRLLPGDLVLVSAVAPGYIARYIRKVQLRGGYIDEHAQWEHAAVYIGRGVICEATRKGVKRAMLSKYVGGHNLRFRRGAELSIQQRYEIAIEAMASRDSTYGFAEIFRLWKSAKWGFGNSTQENIPELGRLYPKRATICSQLFADCYVKVTKNVIGNVDGGESTPACLSSSSQLIDIEMAWLAIA